MEEPVRAPNGSVYDRASVEQYLEEHQRLPDGQAATVAQLTPAEDIVAEVRQFQFRCLLGR